MRPLSSRDRYECQYSFWHVHISSRGFFLLRKCQIEILHWGLCVSEGLVANPVFHHGPPWQGSGCSSEGQSHVIRVQCPNSLLIAAIW